MSSQNSPTGVRSAPTDPESVWEAVKGSLALAEVPNLPTVQLHVQALERDHRKETLLRMFLEANPALPRETLWMAAQVDPQAVADGLLAMIHAV